MSIEHKSTLCGSLARVSSREGHRPALVHAGDTLTYDMLYNSVQAVAKCMQRLQYTRGERFAIVANKTSQTVITLLAALHTSVILVVINPLLKRKQIEYILENSGATTLFCQPATISDWLDSSSLPTTLKTVVFMTASGTGSRTPVSASSKAIQAPFSSRNVATESTSAPMSGVAVLWLSELVQSLESSTEYGPTQLPAVDDIAVILYTSGSTGRPKGVMLSHANLWHGADSVATYLQNTSADRILGLMPLSFDYGLSQLTTAIHSGACLVLHDYVFPKAVAQIVVEQAITGIPAVPHIWDKLARIEWPAVPHLRYLTSTGGRLQLHTIDSLNKRFPDAQLYSMYGFTEAFRGTYLPPKQLDKRPSSIGKAVPHATVLVVDADGRELPARSTGELIQSGPLVSFGYWNDAETSSIKIRPRSTQYDSSQRLYAWSGDLAYTDEEGYIYYVSRMDDQVKLNGHRASLLEIEDLLFECPWISEVAVDCVPDKHFGNVVIAFIVLSVPSDQESLTQWAHQKLPTYMIPVKWITLDALPMTPNNKVDRETLKLRIQKS